MTSPYSKNLKPIDDITPYFHYDEKKATFTFIGKSLELRIPKRLEKHGYLTIGDTVTTLGVMDMIIDNEYQTGFNLIASITISPSDIGKFNYEGIDYVVLYLKENDIFINNVNVLQDPNVIYALWVEFINNGKLIYPFTYKSLLKLFEHTRELTGQGIGVSQSVYEAIIAHLARDNNNISIPYRLTDMTKPMEFVALKSVSQGPTGTLARITGAYFKDEGLTSALRYQIDEPQPFENILRGIVITEKD